MQDHGNVIQEGIIDDEAPLACFIFIFKKTKI